MKALRTIGRRLKAVFAPETIRHRGMILPPRTMRFGGAHFLEEEAFLSAGEEDAQKLMERCGLTKESDLLDIGCGFLGKRLLDQQRGREERGDEPAHFFVLHVHLQCCVVPSLIKD